MGRRALSRALDIWANGQRVGQWRLPARGPMELQYDPTWVSSPEGRPLSLSLPFNLDKLPLKGERMRTSVENEWLPVMRTGIRVLATNRADG
ncbi:MAG: HipA N-terminal domain-containing protein [Rhodocyclaceae bacterium]|nr:HipA N-terminal domain-containing protein [Rhodocyclaceae bacterium]